MTLRNAIALARDFHMKAKEKWKFLACKEKLVKTLVDGFLVMPLRNAEIHLRAFHVSIKQMSLAKLVSAIAVVLILVTLYNFRSASTPHHVVLLTGLTSKTLRDFEDVDRFYDKLWNNRMTYAMAHGNSLRLASHTTRLRPSAGRHE
jgi:hypothetical protein